MDQLPYYLNSSYQIWVWFLLAFEPGFLVSNFVRVVKSHRLFWSEKGVLNDGMKYFYYTKIYSPVNFSTRYVISNFQIKNFLCLFKFTWNVFIVGEDQTTSHHNSQAHLFPLRLVSPHTLIYIENAPILQLYL